MPTMMSQNLTLVDPLEGQESKYLEGKRFFSFNSIHYALHGKMPQIIVL